MKIIRTAFLPLLLLAQVSCETTYSTPTRSADLGVFTQPRVKKAYIARPAIRFPANIAVVRVQEGIYRPASAPGGGSNGAYRVVTQRNVESEADINKLLQLPGVESIVPLNRLLLPSQANSEEDLREAAAKLHADALLIYTVSTEMRSDNVFFPLSAATLGVLNPMRHQGTSSASAVLVDVRSGYVYGALEAQQDKATGSILLDGSNLARDQAERQAFQKLLASFDPFWRKVYARHR